MPAAINRPTSLPSTDRYQYRSRQYAGSVWYTRMHGIVMVPPKPHRAFSGEYSPRPYLHQHTPNQRPPALHDRCKEQRHTF